jgi:hypothetical protein
MDFYYMGEISPQKNNVNQTTIMDDNGSKKPIVKIRFNLKNQVNANMYNYLQE